MTGQAWATFLADEGDGPGEDVHEVGQEVGVLRVVELLDVEHVVVELDHRALVVVRVAVVRRREDRDHQREVAVVPLVHLIAIQLSLVRSDDGQELVGV